MVFLDSILCLLGKLRRAGVNAISTLYDKRDPEFLQTVQLVREITKEMQELQDQTEE